MQVKTFTASSIQAVLAQVKAELGPDAVILSNREIQRDGETLHEVTAGIERDIQEESTQQTPVDATGAKSSGFSMLSPDWNEWYKDWVKIKEHLYALMQPSIHLEKLAPRQRAALEYLQRENVEEGVIMDLYHHLLYSKDLSPLDAMKEIIPIRPWVAEFWPEKIHAISGPFGVGKTTTALRMALLLQQEDSSLRIAFINADCERGNSRFVLRHWAELSEFGYVEAGDIESMQSALKDMENMDYIFIDLPAISGKGDMLATRLVSLGLSDVNFSVHLALSSYYDLVQNRTFFSRYQSTKVQSIVWTKLDEAANYGSLLNVAVMSGIPISALSYGASLRDTLSPAYDSVLWKLIFKHQLP